MRKKSTNGTTAKAASGKHSQRRNSTRTGVRWRIAQIKAQGKKQVRSLRPTGNAEVPESAVKQRRRAAPIPTITSDIFDIESEVRVGDGSMKLCATAVQAIRAGQPVTLTAEQHMEHRALTKVEKDTMLRHLDAAGINKVKWSMVLSSPMTDFLKEPLLELGINVVTYDIGYEFKHECLDFFPFPDLLFVEATAFDAYGSFTYAQPIRYAFETLLQSRLHPGNGRLIVVARDSAFVTGRLTDGLQLSYSRYALLTPCGLFSLSQLWYQYGDTPAIGTGFSLEKRVRGDGYLCGSAI